MFVYRRFPYFLLGFELYPDRLAVASCNCNARTTGQLRLEAIWAMLRAYWITLFNFTAR
jgi:hypothetical protein